MANIKITELNSILEKDSADVLPIVDVSANETKKISIEDLIDKNVELIAVSDTEPVECSIGDKYYNTEDNLIYTAIANDTWGEDGEQPIQGIFYIDLSDSKLYYYDGTNFNSYGGGASLPSYFTDEIDTGMKWIDGKPIYRKVMIETIKSDYTESGAFYSFIRVPFVDELTSSVSGWITASTGTRTDINSRVKSIGYNPNIDGVKTITINFSSSDSSFIGQIVTIIIEYTKTTD